MFKMRLTKCPVAFPHSFPLWIKAVVAHSSRQNGALQLKRIVFKSMKRLSNFSADVNFEELARCTDDFNGAQCKAVCVEAVSRTWKCQLTFTALCLYSFCFQSCSSEVEISCLVVLCRVWLLYAEMPARSCMRTTWMLFLRCSRRKRQIWIIMRRMHPLRLHCVCGVHPLHSFPHLPLLHFKWNKHVISAFFILVAIPRISKEECFSEVVGMMLQAFWMNQYGVEWDGKDHNGVAMMGYAFRFSSSFTWPGFRWGFR